MIVETIFGLGFLFLPSLLMSPMGVTLDETSLSFARMFGSLIISIPFLMFFARKSANLDFKKGVIYCASVYLFISTIILLINQVKGLMNSMGWAIVLLHFVLLVWFGYYALPLKKVAAA
jgi:hypothetical protein